MSDSQHPTKPPSKPPSVAPPARAPFPPRTKSGEMGAVKDFQREIVKYNEETVPILDVQLERMAELLKSVTPTPSAEPDSVPEPIPSAPRTPSMVDAEEIEAAEHAKEEKKKP